NVLGTRFGQRLRDDVRGASRTGLPPPPARFGQTISPTLFPSSPLTGMLHRGHGEHHGAGDPTIGPDGGRGRGRWRRDPCPRGARGGQGHRRGRARPGGCAGRAPDTGSPANRRPIADEDVRRGGAFQRRSAAPAARAVTPSTGVTSRVPVMACATLPR